MQGRQRLSRFPARFYFCRIDRPQPEHHRRNLVVETKRAEVFAGHQRRDLKHVVAANRSANRRGDALSQGRIVVKRRRILALDHLDDGRAILRNAGGHRDSLRDAFDGSQNVLAHFFSVSANRKLQGDFIRNDVAFGAAVNRAHRHHCRIQR